MSMAKANKANAIKHDLTRQQLADELDLHSESVTRHAAMGAPREKRGRTYYSNAGEYRAWMKANNLTGDAHRPAEGVSPDLAAAKLRKENALASRYEIEVARARGELVPLVEVKAEMGQQITTAKNKLRGLGAAITPLLEGRDAAERQGIIDNRIEEILNDLAAAR